MCINVILSVGFGPGTLRRNHVGGVVRRAPYLFIRQPDVGTYAFSFDDPGVYLHFHWFKHRVMCVEKPWICEHGDVMRFPEHSNDWRTTETNARRDELRRRNRRLLFKFENNSRGVEKYNFCNKRHL